ncbi:hypothetical protein EDB83DRAFT_2321561 [Lactarius deliciosus]|nr:hypothetical protein EDB83DRAFT_2321561 [Lactarius deliciosus]
MAIQVGTDTDKPTSYESTTRTCTSEAVSRQCPRETAGERLSTACLHVLLVRWARSYWQVLGAFIVPSRHYHHHLSSRMPSNLFSRKQSKKQRIPRPHPATSDDHPVAHVTTVVSDIDTHGDITISAIQTSLAALKEGSALATKLPFIAPIAGLLLQAFTMRDEVKQYKEECEIVMHKLARIARIIVDVGELCEHHNLTEEDLPAGLRTILGSLQRTRELDRIERVLKECSKRKGIKRMLLRKDLLTKIKQCDVEISNVLQAFQAKLLLDVRVALISARPEAASDPGPVEAAQTIHQELNGAQILLGTKRALNFGLNAKGPDLITRSRSTALDHFFFFKSPTSLTPFAPWSLPPDRVWQEATSLHGVSAPGERICVLGGAIVCCDSPARAPPLSHTPCAQRGMQMGGAQTVFVSSLPRRVAPTFVRASFPLARQPIMFAYKTPKLHVPKGVLDLAEDGESIDLRIEDFKLFQACAIQYTRMLSASANIRYENVTGHSDRVDEAGILVHGAQ